MQISVDQSVDVGAPAERAWELVSTSDGISSWFTSATVTPGPSGSVTLRFAPGAEGTMPIRRWEPPYRIRFGAAEGQPGRAHQFEVAATSTGARVRVIDVGVDAAEGCGAKQTWARYLDRLKALAEG